MTASFFPFEDREDKIRSALALDLDYKDRSHARIAQQNPNPIPAAVLVLFAFSRANVTDQDLFMLFTQRTDSVETHRGQMAFPGGHCEPGDQNDPVISALRETEEEIGIRRQGIKILGRLPKVVTITGFVIDPIVGFLAGPFEDYALQVNRSEIAEAIWVPLGTLHEPGVYREETISAEGTEYPIHVYQVGPYRIWGATASMTKNLLDRMSILTTGVEK